MASLTKNADGTLEITLTIPWVEVTATVDKLIDEAVKTAELPGFRQGKAPRNLVEKNLDRNKLYEDAIRDIIPKAYDDAVRDLKIRPIMIPKIHLHEATEGKDWIVIAKTCEKPSVKLNEYKTQISDLNSSQKKQIWTPGTDLKDKKPDEKETKPTLEELLNTLMSAVEVQIPEVLIEEEINRLLSELIDQTKKLGLTVDQYLASTRRTSESIKEEYKEQSKRTLTLEFTLEQIADLESITITDEDIQKTIDQAKTDAEKEELSKQKYYLASVLRRRKTLDYLASL